VSVENKERLIDDLERRIAETIAGTPVNPMVLPGMYEKCVEVLATELENVITILEHENIAVNAVRFHKMYKEYAAL
jgi:hypothetical protein